MGEPRSFRSLKSYRDKRDFNITPEPAAGGVPNELQRAFVIQKHWATRLHYDLRLELEGNMKSWAVPKGPSFDAADKRMAMHVEDHPISYNSFEGVIPPKQYGAGKVIIWDRGIWVPLEDPLKGYREGRLKFELQGHKLHGRWTLVRMKGRSSGRQEPWLLIKEKDRYARPAQEFSVVDEMPDSVKHLADRPRRHASTTKPVEQSQPASGPPPGARKAALPDQLQPELATLVEAPPEDWQGWVFEIKFDGYRMLTRAQNGRVKLITRNCNDWTEKLPQLQQALESMELPDGWYDGEITMPGKRVLADFQALQSAFDNARTADIVYFMFDIPYCAGYDLRHVPLLERRAVLQRILERKPHEKIRLSAVFDARPQDVVASACRLGLEGVIGKRKNCAYVSRRSSDWIKLKCGLRQEFIIGGYTDPKGARTGIGSLLLGVHGKQGELQYTGNVGTGFNEQALRQLRSKLEALQADQSPFEAYAEIPKKAHWVKPELVCEVAFGEWTKAGRIRHSVFHGLRSDKPAAAVTHEKPRHFAPIDKPAQKANKAIKSPDDQPAASLIPSSLKVSHPDRVIDPASKAAKIDLVRYYALVAPLMMEHLRGRPVALVRAPAGIGGELFFQKHAGQYDMPGIEQLDPAFYPGHPPLLEVVSTQGLLSAAQMNVIEFHTWNAVKTAIDKPDRMTFDLDPGEGVDWPRIQQAVQLVHAFLGELGLTAFLKTSGGKGLHVVVPILKQFDWDTVKDFSQMIVQHLARTIPRYFVAKSGPANRVGRIFIDYLRNGYGATTVAAWSARCRPGLGISVPVRWDELGGLKSGAHWAVASIHTRLDEGNLPWQGYDAASKSLTAAMQGLGFRQG